MTPFEYREFCKSTYAAPEGTDREEYLRLLLIEELGEVASLFAKAMRDGVRRICTKCGGHGFVDNVKCHHCDRGGITTYGAEAVDRDRLKKELGDVMWCAAMLNDSNYTWDVARHFHPTTTSTLLREIAEDTVWHTFQTAKRLCQFLGFDPEEVAIANVEKLRDRQRRGKIHGSGDER